MTRSAILAAALAGLVASLPARADTVLEGTMTGAGPGAGSGKGGEAGPQRMTTYLTPDKLRVEMPGHEVIYRGDLGKVWAIQPAQKSYLELTPDEMRRVRDRATEARERAARMIEQQLSKMPPDQREAARKAMAGHLPGNRHDPKLTYRKTASDVKVGRWRCDAYDRLADGKKVGSMCVARLDALGIDPADMKVADRMSDLFASPEGARQDIYGIEAMRRITGHEGMPIRTETMVDGKLVHDFELTGVQHPRIPASTFELPPGLEKRELPAALTGAAPAGGH